ncbi:MAG: GAF domain-containing protein [Deltaproteobacteria bacterium]|nr:GAF domain-containing protein [Deltaproteobacteria bacterium]MBW2446953.1 GAF domain-containing protein [Deltaproteobacteria bacterium]
MSDDKKVFGRAEEFMSLFNQGAEFTKELLQENERLRHDLLAVNDDHRQAAADPGDWAKLRVQLLTQIDTLTVEKENVLERLKMVEAENRQFAERYVEIEEENNNLANLYVSSYQLHSTLALSEVLKIIIEIVINLIGAEVFAVYVQDERSGTLEAVASEGTEVEIFPKIAPGAGVIGGSVASGETHCGDTHSTLDWETPIACIPLRVQDRPIGAIAIYSLLEQKETFTPLDHELFTLLAGHAATAIFAAQLYSQSERKLNTIQGFIDLLTK